MVSYARSSHESRLEMGGFCVYWQLSYAPGDTLLAACNGTLSMMLADEEIAFVCLRIVESVLICVMYAQ